MIAAIRQRYISMNQQVTNTTGFVFLDVMFSVLAIYLAYIGNALANIDIWLQRGAWIFAIIVSVATLAKIFVVDFKLINKNKKCRKRG